MFLISSANFAQLRHNVTIQKLVAAFLLLIFSVSAAPKTYFHDLLANHKDFSNCKKIHHTAVLHQQGYNCHFDDLVVTTPYLYQDGDATVGLEFIFQQEHISFCKASFQTCILYKESRGPPFC